jgi:hypothetical protein
LDLVVAEQLLDVPQVGSSLQQMRAAGVPQPMRINRVRDSSGPSVIPKQDMNQGLAHSLSRPGEEQGGLAWTVNQVRPRLLQVKV